MADLNIAISKRATIKRALTRFSNYLNSETKDIRQIRERLAKCEPLYEEFNNIQENIELLSEDELIQEQERELFENSYFNVTTLAKSFLSLSQNGSDIHVDDGNYDNSDNDKESVATRNSGLVAQTKKPGVKLPTIKLPTFNGKHDEWVSFKELFEALVDKDNSISEVQKFYYLRTALSGEAANVIHSLELSGSNYKVAWDLLRQNYENKFLISQRHVELLFTLPKLERESASGLRQLLNNSLKHIRALHGLGEEIDKWDLLLIHIITSKLDQKTLREWMTTVKTCKEITFEKLKDFLVNQCNMLEAVSTKDAVKTKSFSKGTFQESKIGFNAQYQSRVHVNLTKRNCCVCSGEHQIYKCEKFLKLPVQDRIQKIKDLKLCINCLKSGHGVKRCLLRKGCFKCQKSHNTLIHIDEAPQIQNSNEIEEPSTVVGHSIEQKSSTQVLLSTALIDVQNGNGGTITCRALLDCGSQSNFITEAVVQKLKLKKQNADLTLLGISTTNTKIKHSCRAFIQSKRTAHKFGLTFLVLNKITNHLPSEPVNLGNWRVPSNIQLADPHFFKPGQIDILLGAEVFWEILSVGQVKPSIDRPILQKTTLGWVVGGSATVFNQPNQSRALSVCNFSTIDEFVNNNVNRFWEIESCPNESTFSVEDKECEINYCENLSFSSEGRFIVCLPLKGNLKDLEGSKEAAIKRFYQLEKRLDKDEILKTAYVNFMNEYMKLNHMEVIPYNERMVEYPTYYIPHHPVLRTDSLTTKLRVVFDASCNTSSKASLNDLLMNGPVVQDQLCSIVIRFRKHKYVMCADIEKMYRQVLISENQKDLQRIIWRENSTQPLNEYRLLTVTYGTRSAPYLATRTLIESANLNEQQFPVAASIIKRDFYVDDLMTGVDTVEEAVLLQNELKFILGKYGFILRKWCSNNAEILSNISSDIENPTIHEIQTNDTIKTLGLRWHPQSDEFSYSINVKHSKGNISKRTILSQIAQVFDPLGLVAPVIVYAKILLQELWQLKLSWDETPPMCICTKWLDFTNALPSLNNIRIDRKLGELTHDTKKEIHGFADASQKAYGAAVYMRCVDNKGKVTVRLICAKSRVAPMKTISLPRLELSAALLLAELVDYVKSALDIELNSVHYWTDSTIVLCWISSPSNHWTTFVANRVSKIHDLSNSLDWKHIKGEYNPADCVSRGLLADQLCNFELWWNGPSWLLETQLPEIEQDDPQLHLNEVPERKKIKFSMIVAKPNSDFINKYSSLPKLLRIVAYCRRFLSNIRSHLNCSVERQSGNLSIDELNQALQALIRQTQLESFGEEILALKSGKPVSNKSKLKSLNPFIDSSEILRVGGRLEHSELSYYGKHPILLPNHNHLTELIALNEHILNLHVGPQGLLAAIRSRYWPLNGRSLVKKIVNKCVTCFRAKPRCSEQLMGDLPKVRVQPVRPFINVGIDFAGPIFIKQGRQSKTLVKAYIALFICLATKAIHVELVRDLTSEAFIGSLKRFISRRGKCANIFCDNAKNFVGAQREIKELKELFFNEITFDKIDNYLKSEEGIKWHFIPSRSPHMGGIWESGVRAIKYHLKRVLGNTHLTFDEFYTTLTQIEACINSRPILPLNDNPNDLRVLTPSHFLIGDRLTAMLEPDLTDQPMSRLSRWQRTQQLVQHFWKRWSKEYLSSLQHRVKWTRRQDNIKINTIVLLKEDNLPPLQWRMGKIIATHPGADGVVRVVTIQTSSGVTKRAIAKVCPLPIEDNQ